VRFCPKAKKTFKIWGAGGKHDFFDYLLPSFPKINSKNIARYLFQFTVGSQKYRKILRFFSLRELICSQIWLHIFIG